MEPAFDILLALLRDSVCEHSANNSAEYQISPEILPKLYALSKSHDMAHIVAQKLSESGWLDNDEVSQKFGKQQMLAVYRYQQSNYELERICQTLEAAEIPFIPLKGSVIRQYYPEPWMRTSCDIDILVHEEDIQKAMNRLSEELHYKINQRYSHDYSLHSPSGVHFELHYTLMEDHRAGNSRPILLSVWEHSKPMEGQKYHYVMSDEMFFFYHIAHMAKHFETGGCGIKPFLDLWILENQVPHNEELRNALLKKSKLLTFANTCRRLSQIWFDNKEHDDLTLALQEYVLYGGVYGTVNNRVAVQQEQTGGKLHYVWSRIFMPYDLLKYMYPTLQKHKWLLPFFHVRRWCRILFKTGVAKARREMKASQSLSNEQKEKVSDLLKQLELS